MKRINVVALGLAAASVAQAFSDAGERVAGAWVDEAHVLDSPATKRSRLNKWVGCERRPKGKGERKRTRGDWSNSRGRQGW